MTCIACGKVFTAEDDVVVCPVCGAPHHRTCWMASGVCAKNDAHAAGYTWIFPEEILRQRNAQDASAPAADVRDRMQLKNGENVVECPGCGAACYENDIYCLRCGTRLDGTQPEPGNAAADDAPYDTMDIHAIRNDFDRFGGISPDALVDGIPCWEYAEYVGGTKPGRIIRKVSTMERFGRKTSWSWAALFLGPIWFFWRKMKKEGAILSVIAIFLAALLAVVQLNSSAVDYYKKSLALMEQAAKGEIGITEMQERTRQYTEEFAAAAAENPDRVREAISAGLEYCLFVGLPLVCSLISVPLYRKKVKADILQIRTRCSSMDEYVSALRAEGGYSGALFFVGVLLMVLALLSALYLPFIVVALFM